MSDSRPSVFRTSLRMFFGSLFGVLGGLIALVAIIGGIAASMGTPVTKERVSIAMAPDAHWNRTMLPDTAPVILRIDVQGVIGMGRLRAKHIRSQIFEALDRYVRTQRLKGILLYIDTPGGLASDSDQIYETLETFKKRYSLPVYAYVEGMCASGGMYIAASADKIFSSATGIIGSVGVRFGPVLNWSEIMQKHGVSALTLTQGEDKDMLNPTKPFDPKKYQSLVDIMENEYTRFVDVVSKARPKLTKEKLTEEYGARVFPPSKAAELGYIDGYNKSYADTLDALTEAGGIAKEQKYQVVQIFPYPTLFKDLFGEEAVWRTKTITHKVALPEELDPELMNKVLYLYQPSQHNE